MQNMIVPSSRAWGRRDSLALALLLAAMVATFFLGRWQQGRAQAKRELLATIASHSALPPLSQLPPQLADKAWRAAAVRGSYQPDWTLFLRNRNHGEASGDLVLTPLRLAGSSRYLMVERGWVAVATDGAPPRLVTPAVERGVLGRLAPPPSSWLALGPESDAAVVRQNIDLAHFAAIHHIELLPYVLQQTQPEAGLLTDWPQPDLGIATNQGYAFQWWAMSALSGLLLLAFVYKRLRHAPEEGSDAQP